MSVINHGLITDMFRGLREFGYPVTKEYVRGVSHDRWPQHIHYWMIRTNTLDIDTRSN